MRTAGCAQFLGNRERCRNTTQRTALSTEPEASHEIPTMQRSQPAEQPGRNLRLCGYPTQRKIRLNMIGHEIESRQCRLCCA